MKRRTLEALPVSTAREARAALPHLQHALDGEGAALLPVADADSRLFTKLGVGSPLNGHEDDEADPTALVIATSGSTGEPKGVLLSSSALRASANATHNRLGGSGRWLLAMPAHHIAGIQVLIRSVLAGTEPEILDLSEGFTAARFADAARHVLTDGNRHYTALVPTQLSRLLADDDGIAALREFDAVLLGGAATSASLRAQAETAGVAITTTYGMTETCGGCVYDGTPLHDVQVALDDDGRILLAGPVLARGYRLGDTHSAFHHGWLRTSDLGTVDEHGQLEVLGRADDVIITGGVNVAPAAVEHVLSDVGGVREVCVVGLPDQQWGHVVAAAVIPDGDPPSLGCLRARVRAELGAAHAPKYVRFLDRFPLRGPGKPDRAAIRATMQTPQAR